MQESKFGHHTGAVIPGAAALGRGTVSPVGNRVSTENFCFVRRSTARREAVHAMKEAEKDSSKFDL